MENVKLKISDLVDNEWIEVKEEDNLIISDPCYEKDYVNSKLTFISQIVKPKAGRWYYNSDEDTMTLDVYHERGLSYVNNVGINKDTFDEILEVCVDSGQIGVFLENSYQNDSLVKDIELKDDYLEDTKDLWYKACCELTSKYRYGFIKDGFISQTRYGDGRYPIGIKYYPGTKEVVYIRIITDDICEDCGCELPNCDCEICDICGQIEGFCECEYCEDCEELACECACSEND